MAHEPANHPISQLATTILENEESVQVYRTIIADRIRARIDPEYSEYDSNAEANNLAQPYLELTLRYILLAAQLADQVLAIIQPNAHSATAFRDLLSHIWQPLPDSDETDFDWVETLCAAVVSNQVIGMLATPAQAHLQRHPWLARRNRPNLRAKLTDVVAPLYGEEIEELKDGFHEVFLTHDAEAAIDFARERLEERAPNEDIERVLHADEALQALGQTHLQAGPIFGAIPLDEDPLAVALKDWFAQKKAGGEHTSMLPQHSPFPEHEDPEDAPLQGQRAPSPLGRPFSSQMVVSQPGRADRWAAVRPVWFATRRAPIASLPSTPDHVATVQEFGSKVDTSSMHYGAWGVGLANGVPLTRTIFNTDLTVTSNKRSYADEAALCGEIQAALHKITDPTKRDILVYVHGFNTPFNNAIRDTGWLGPGLNFPGERVCFSWPALGSYSFATFSTNHATVLADYNRSRVRAERAAGDLEKLLVALLNIPEAHKVHVIAHSLGARTLMLALEIMSIVYGARKRPNSGQMLIVAADMERVDFKRVAQSCVDQAERATIYVSSKDRALRLASGWWKPSAVIPAGAVRVGLSLPPPLPRHVVDAINSIDVSYYARPNPQNFNHLYHLDTPEVFKDLECLLQINTDPHVAPRTSKRQQYGSTVYWVLEP